SKNLGVAFQILNDLKDWDGDSDNKVVVGQDVIAARPTLLLALALEGSSPAQREELLTAIGYRPSENGKASSRNGHHAGLPADSRLERVRQCFERATVFDKAEK